MSYHYEFVQTDALLPVKTLIHEVKYVKLHWHGYMEFLMVLKGSVEVKVGSDKQLLNAGDFILINSNQIHSIFRTDVPNVVLAVQINPGFFVPIYPHWREIYFYCHSLFDDDAKVVHERLVKKYLAHIVLEINKQQHGYRSRIGSNLYLLARQMFHFPYHRLEDIKDRTTDEDLARLREVTNYVQKNLHKQITLKEIGEAMYVSYHHLSRFVLDKLDISFQEYINILRLEKAVDLIVNGNKSMQDIAGEIGYASVSSLNRLFKNHFNVTPGEYKDSVADPYMAFNPQADTRATYRKMRGKGKSQAENAKTYLDVCRQDMLAVLFDFLDVPDHNSSPVHLKDQAHKQRFQHVALAVDAQKKGYKNNFYWRRLVGFTRAAEGLRQNWQQQLRQMQREIGFEQIRCHGIFDDAMMVYRQDIEGNTIYNWTYVDQLFDSLLQANIKPFVELGFIPKDLASSDETVFWWQAHIDPPKDISRWTSLVQALIRHCLNRYGADEVAGWNFEVWNEPELKNLFWLGTRQQYFDFYQATAWAVKQISPHSAVGGPAITHQTLINSNWLQDFLIYCRKNKVPLDFVSLHIYPEHFPADFEMRRWSEQLRDKTLSPRQKQKIMQQLTMIYHGPDHPHEILQSARAIIKKHLGYLPQLYITEWNASAHHRNLINDTAYVAAFIVHHVVRCQGLADMLGYWTFTDINEENQLDATHFHGNFGLMNKDGIKKASYYAYYLLGKMGDEIIDQGDGYLVTRSSQGVQILMYNYTYFDQMFLKGDVSLLTATDRYRVFADKLDYQVNLTVTGVNGSYKISRYRLNRNHGSSFDQWVQMGAPESMSPEEVEYLQNTSRPHLQAHCKQLDGIYQAQLNLPVHGVELVLLQKMY